MIYKEVMLETHTPLKVQQLNNSDKGTKEPAHSGDSQWGVLKRTACNHLMKGGEGSPSQRTRASASN